MLDTEFLLTALVVVASPGIGALFTIAAGLARGKRAALVAAFACTLGIVPHMAAAITGLAALLHASALAFEALRALGVVYLLYMAWATWRDRGGLDPTAAPAPGGVGRVIAAGILANLLNPKLTLFFFAFLPQFVRPEAPDAVARMLGLSAVFMAMTFAVFALYGVAAGLLRRRVLARPATLGWLRRGFAAGFALMGARLALAERG